jgi:hypothetical protein
LLEKLILLRGFVVVRIKELPDLSSLPTQAGGVPVLVLKEGANRSRGREAQHNNITAAQSCRGKRKKRAWPQSMDKMLVDNFGDVTITSDGRTILDEMDVQTIQQQKCL